MKTLVKEPENKSARRKVLKDELRKVENKKKESIHFELKRNDYDDLINLKRKRNKQQKEKSVLFFLLGLCMTLGSLIVVFNWNFEDASQGMVLGNLDNDNFEDIQEMPNTEQPPPPPPMVLQQPIIVEVPDKMILEEVEVNLDVEITEETIIQEVEFEPIEEEVAEEIFEIVEDAPAPIGGFKAFYSFVASKLRYPTVARRNSISGKVYVKFVVDQEGKLNNIHVIKGIGGGCDEEAIRVVGMAPDWKPGKQRGRAVKVWMTLPFTFVLEKSSR